jgi:hypothetical protein
VLESMEKAEALKFMIDPPTVTMAQQAGA